LRRGDAGLAFSGCQRLLNTNPRDVAARHLRGCAAAASGHLRHAVTDFKEALVVEPGHFPARADLGVALTALGQYHEARVHLGTALRQDGRPPQLHFALGQCHFASGDFRSAADGFRAAISRDPDFADAHSNLGVALDRLGDLEAAIGHFERACALQPDRVHVHRNAADALRRVGRITQAITALERAMALAPGDPELGTELAEALLDAGQREAALRAALSVLGVSRDNARAQATAGMALASMDRGLEAVDHFAAALRLEPRLSYVAVNLGETLLSHGRIAEAAEAFRAALAGTPLAAAHLGLARALGRLGDRASARRHLLDAHAADPADADTAISVAGELEQLGASEQALAMLSQASVGSPADARVHHTMGAILHRQGRYADALAWYQRALDLDPQLVRALIDRGHACESLGQLATAIASFDAALRIQPRSAPALAGLASCAFRACDWPRLETSLESLQSLPEGLEALHPFLLLALKLRASEQLPVMAHHAPPPLPRPDRPARRVHSRLRIAYVSPDFREHPVAHALVGVIEAHDRARVEVLGVSLAAADSSTVSSRLRGAFDRMIEVTGLPDDEALARLRDLEVDIAVDLAGHTVGARPALFAARCAPMQVNYLGFPATTGSTFMDYIIADEVVIPVADERAYSERVLRLPGCYLPLDSSSVVTTGTIDRAGVGLPENGTVFCAFNNAYKISRDMFGLWMSLLREVPESVLWLRRMDPLAFENLSRFAAESGISPSRLIVAPYAGHRQDYLAMLRLADLFLDTAPYNAHTTGSDALWTGVPVLSLRGESFAGRVGASLLSAAGLHELVCSSPLDYRDKALRLADDSGELRALRSRLAGLRDSGAFDTSRYARNLESLYEAMRCG
jgi:protein O-GlcNAc transferase